MLRDVVTVDANAENLFAILCDAERAAEKDIPESGTSLSRCHTLSS